MQNELDFGNNAYKIGTWADLNSLPVDEHDPSFINTLNKHGFGNLVVPVPLKGRYTRGRRWTAEEFEACYNAWSNGVSLTLIAASLNRNPQDMIYKLLDRCKEDGVKFTQKGRTEQTKNWTSQVKSCAEELFEQGLPAWKIAAIFQIEFEHVEKELFVNRKGYGHEKKNPFTINTDHKQFVNEAVIQGIEGEALEVLEAFAGEGRFTNILVDAESIGCITSVEVDKDTFENLSKNVTSADVNLINSDNLEYFKSIAGEKKFDLIDLDPFVTCHEQLRIVWDFLKEDAYLFVTFGGEYRRSFIKTNRKSIYERYGFFDESSDNSEYLEIIPFYFLGFVAEQASKNGFEFEVLRAVRYANNCRFWLKVRHAESKSWFSDKTEIDGKGVLFNGLHLPRFKEVRKEIDDAKKLGFAR
ncbi:class I SAM-dependent methyltransferase [Vibrio alfacsensis]|uniref:class I SAM-dependent methyltransferase n=1 Tax=Vibrio alfacsensis TaxID=1074311 RepID=UPI004067DFDB